MCSDDTQVLCSETLNIENEVEKKPIQTITSKVTTFLRWTGSLMIVLSAINFMLQGTDDMLPAYRYWIGLGFTLLLCGGGLVCAYLFKETKGARIFFGLGTAFIPVQVTQVAAMIYAYWHGNNAMQPEYVWLQFMDVSPTTILLDLVLTAALLYIVSYASYAILARKYLKTLIIASVVGNALLLLPIRDTNLVAIIIAGLFIYLRQIEEGLHQDSSMRLMEGMAARVLAFLPLLIIIGRSFLHPGSYLLAIVICAIAVIYFIYDIKRYTQLTLLLYIAQWAGTIAAIVFWFILAEQYSVIAGNPVVSNLPVVGILFLLSEQVQFHIRSYRNIASALAVFLCFSAMLDDQVSAPIISFTTGVLLVIAGLKYKEKVPFFTGSICVAGSLLFYLEYVGQLYSSAPWISSIIVGLLVILLASYLENKEKKIVQQSKQYFNELKSWG